MRRRNEAWLVALALLAPGAGARAAAGEATLESLFPSQAALELEGEVRGLARLVLPAEVAAACRPDLSDVRIVDAAGREVPYLIDSGRGPEEPLAEVETFVPRIEEVSRQTREREHAPAVQTESYELSLPEMPTAGGGWSLVVDSGHRRFVRRLQLSERLPGGDLRSLAVDRSVFRLPEQGLVKIRVDLPPLSGTRLVVRLEGDEGFFLEPRLRFESSRLLAGAERARVELTELDRRSAAGRTEIELERPRGLLPDLLVVETSTASFSRKVEVWDEGPGSRSGALGSGLLLRIAGFAPVEQTEIELGSPSGDKLLVVIEDGDSPPLEAPRFEAAMRRPVLLFSTPEGAGLGGWRLLFGGGRAYRPEYDLARLPPSLPATGAAAERAERLYDPAASTAVRLGPVAGNPAFDPAPALAFAMHPGSEIDARLYTHHQRLVAEPSAEGLVRIPLSLELLARARDDLADLRIADDSGRQWAYLVEASGRPRSRRLGVQGPKTKDGVSRYELELPVRPAAPDQILLQTAIPFFDRSFRCAGSPADGARERQLTAGRLVRRIGDPRPLQVELPGGRIESLALEIEDGDDAPLAFDRVEARFPAPELYLAAPAGGYELLVGNPTDRAPSYELRRVRDVVLAVAAGEATEGPVEENPRFSTRARLAGRGGLATIALWVAIGVAVLVLAWLSLRLARQQDGP